MGGFRWIIDFIEKVIFIYVRMYVCFFIWKEEMYFEYLKVLLGD